MGALTALLLNLTSFTLLTFVPLALMFILTWELVSQFPVIEECGWRLGEGEEKLYRGCLGVGQRNL